MTWMYLSTDSVGNTNNATFDVTIPARRPRASGAYNNGALEVSITLFWPEPRPGNSAKPGGHAGRDAVGLIDQRPPHVSPPTVRFRQEPVRRMAGSLHRGGSRMTKTSFEHVTDVREALRRVVSDTAYGPDALSSPRTMSDLLQRLLPDAPRERSTLLAAVAAGLADTIRRYVAGGMDASTAVARSAASLAASQASMPIDACYWVAAEIALALGLITAEKADAIGSGREEVARPGPSGWRPADEREQLAPAGIPDRLPLTIGQGQPGQQPARQHARALPRDPVSEAVRKVGPPWAAGVQPAGRDGPGPPRTCRSRSCPVARTPRGARDRPARARGSPVRRRRHVCVHGS